MIKFPIKFIAREGIFVDSANKTVMVIFERPEDTHVSAHERAIYIQNLLNDGFMKSVPQNVSFKSGKK